MAESAAAAAATVTASLGAWPALFTYRMTSLSIRQARPQDVSLVRAFILELAEYERLAHEAVLSEADVERALFDNPPRAHCNIAWEDDDALGFALWFYNFSTFVGRAGIWLEDLFVRPHARGRGVGSALLKDLAKRCVEEKLGRLEWAVLNWNAPSIAFYDSLGAAAMTEWTTRRLTGDAVTRLAES